MLKLRKDKTERAYLTIDELERLANKEFALSNGVPMLN